MHLLISLCLNKQNKQNPFVFRMKKKRTDLKGKHNFILLYCIMFLYFNLYLYGAFHTEKSTSNNSEKGTR